MEDPDVRWVRFFHEIVRDEIELDTAADHKRSLKRVVKSELRGPSRGNGVPDAPRRCALVFHGAPCLASACARHFARLLTTDYATHHLRIAPDRGTCTVCCCVTSASPPAELASLVEALSDGGRSRSADPVALRVKALLIGRESERWTDALSKMADRFSSESGGLLDLRFLSADLARPLTDDVKEALGQSDVVTMVHLLSSLHQRGDSLRAVKELVPFLREGSVLFFLDEPSFRLCDVVRKTISSFENMTEIYGPLHYDVHRISLLCRKECLRLYSRHYGWTHCALQTTSYVCAWHKRTT